MNVNTVFIIYITECFIKCTNVYFMVFIQGEICFINTVPIFTWKMCSFGKMFITCITNLTGFLCNLEKKYDIIEIMETSGGNKCLS